MDRITTIGFDADDTLWHNERFFHMTQEHFAGLLAEYTERATLMARLLDAEKRNLARYGYGIKGFMLSMIETAIEVTDGRVPGSVISDILSAGQDMLRHPIELLPPCRREHPRAGAITPSGPDYKGRLAGPRAQAGAVGPGRSVRRDRDRVGKDTRHLCKNFRPPWRRGPNTRLWSETRCGQTWSPRSWPGLGACMCRKGWNGKSSARTRPAPTRDFARCTIWESCPILSAGSTAADAASCGQSWADRYTCAKNIKNCPKHVE